ncbi:MAG TPA: VOC family protein [Woeseiaceae bacterium]|nr:VOC family protein [Woeseiaceae bacterium]
MVHEMFAYLCVHDGTKAIEFYREAFGATEKFRLVESGGRIGHAELDFNGTTLMLSEEYPECGINGPKAIGGTPVTIHLHVDNADEVIERAVRAGATLERAAQDAFYGERSGTFFDPFGHRWNIGHQIEELSAEEMQRRYAELTKDQ